MSRDYGWIERQILAVLEADQGANVCFSLESLVYAVSGYIANLGDDYTRPDFRQPICDCKSEYLPGIGKIVRHRDSCYPGPTPPSRAQVSAIQRGVRNLEHKGVLNSIVEGTRRPERWGQWHPCRMKYLWRAETTADQLCAWARAQRDWRGRIRLPRLWMSKCYPYGMGNT